MFKFLINTWFMLLFPMFAAGAVADLGTAGGIDAGVGEDVSNADNSGDAGDSGTVLPEGGGADEGANPDDTAEGVRPGEGEARQDGRTISPQLRKVLAETKASNPEAYKQLKGVVFSEQAFRQQFPGGPTEAAALKSKLDEMGGFEAVEEIQSEVQDYRGFDDAWIKGDPAFLQNAIAKGGSEGFKKLMPSMIQTYANVDKEGFNRELSKIMGATFDQAGLSNTLMWAKRLLGMNQDVNSKEALAQIEGIEQWVGGLKELASKAPVTPQNDPKTQELTQREQTIQQNEHKQFLGGVTRDYQSYAGSKISVELKQLAPKGIPEGASGKIIEQVNAELQSILFKDKAFVTKYENLCNAHDHEGALKLLKSKVETKGQRGTTLLADATKKVYRTWYGEPKLGTKKPASAPGVVTGQAKAAQGWTRIGKPPTPDQIDSRQSKGRIFFSQAILKSGAKVYWGDKIPS